MHDNPEPVDQGRIAYARTLRQGVTVDPRSPDILHNLALCQLDGAVGAQWISRALAVAPYDMPTLANGGNLALAVGQRGVALRRYRRALSLAPGIVDITYNIGNIDDAIWLRRSLALSMDRPAIYNNLAVREISVGRLEASRRYLRRAIAIAPAFAAAYRNLSDALRQLRHSADAANVGLRSTAIAPEWSDAWQICGDALLAVLQWTAAAACYRRAVALSPADRASWINFAWIAANSGSPEAGIAGYGHATAIAPARPEAAGDRLFAFAFLPHADEERIRRETAIWARRERRMLGDLAPPRNDNDPRRRLRIGYVSPEFARQGFMYEIMPVLARHNRSSFEIYAYGQGDREDDWTGRVRDSVDGWRRVSSLSLDGQVEVIRRDGIDILVNLTGYLGQHRRLFMRRICPVQVAYINHVMNPGLESIDAWITDPWIDPSPVERSTDSLTRTIPLSSGWSSVEPIAPTPDMLPLPALSRGHVTFGSFNNFAKLSPATIALWAEILRRIPSSRLIIKAMALSDPYLEAITRDRFLKLGVDPARIDTLGFIPDTMANLEAVSAVDIALDPFPFNGGISTMETLWMGVPLVTMTGPTLLERLGTSLLSRAGLHDWITTSPEGYVAKAVNMASDIGRLGEVRRRMRSRLQGSVLFDTAAHTAELERTYRDLWLEWCRAGDTAARHQGSGART